MNARVASGPCINLNHVVTASHNALSVKADDTLYLVANLALQIEPAGQSSSVLLKN